MKNDSCTKYKLNLWFCPTKLGAPCVFLNARPSKSMKAFEIFFLEMKKENELFTKIENVGFVASIILFQFCDVAKVGNHPLADLAKYGY